MCNDYGFSCCVISFKRKKEAKKYLGVLVFSLVFVAIPLLIFGLPKSDNKTSDNTIQMVSEENSNEVVNKEDDKNNEE